MCSICFERFTDAQLARDPDDANRRMNVCLPCAEREGVALFCYFMAGLAS